MMLIDLNKEGSIPDKDCFSRFDAGWDCDSELSDVITVALVARKYKGTTALIRLDDLENAVCCRRIVICDRNLAGPTAVHSTSLQPMCRISIMGISTEDT